MAGEQTSNTVRAGVFVITCVALAVAVGFILSRSNFFKVLDRYQIRFTLEDGVAGLSTGSDVQVGGLSRGTVVDVEPKPDAHGDVDEILVTIELDHSISLFKRTSPPFEPHNGVQVIRVASPLGNTATINFASVGSPDLVSGVATNKIKPGDIIDASSGSGLLASLVGADNAIQVGDILRSAARFTDALDTNGSPMLVDARQVVAKVAQDYEVWRDQVTSALESADTSLARINGYLAPTAKVDVFLDNAVEFAGSARDVMVEARDTSMPKVETILDYALASVVTLDSTLGQAQAEFTAEVPTIRAFLANAREAATQLKLGTIEVRRNPWRLMGKPGPDEISNENLYQAAADFAAATSDLNVASETLRAVLTDERSRFARDPGFRALIEQQVLTAVARFEKSQATLSEILNSAPGAKNRAP